MKFGTVFCLAVTVGLVKGYLGRAVNVKTCPQELPDVDLCRRTSLQELVQLLGQGLPNIGLPPSDPLDNLPPLVWRGVTQAGPLAFALEQPRLTGLSGSVVDDLQVDLASNRIRVVTHVPGALVLDAIHATEGDIMGVSYKGKGNFKLTMVNSNVEVTYQGQPAAGPDGHTYLRLVSASVKLSEGSTNYEFGGLFGDYAPLVHAGNLFINNVAAPSVIDDLRPALEKWLEGIFLQRAQGVFNTVPYDTLFPRTPARYLYNRAFFAPLY